MTTFLEFQNCRVADLEMTSLWPKMQAHAVG